MLSLQATLSLSVVVPALNEEERLALLLRRLQGMAGVGQIVVCDGGSRDATVQTARDNGAVVVQAPSEAMRNRGAQLNLGARAAQSEVLWFLHADARPHPQSAGRIHAALRDRRVAGGNFRLRFDERRAASRLFESIARVQRSLGVYYGDSGLWLRREAFDGLGGFRPWPLFEDYELARRLQRRARGRSQRTVCLPLPLVVSARRFNGGAARLLLMWVAFQTLFHLGVSPHRLARFYHR